MGLLGKALSKGTKVSGRKGGKRRTSKGGRWKKFKPKG